VHGKGKATGNKSKTTGKAPRATRLERGHTDLHPQASQNERRHGRSARAAENRQRSLGRKFSLKEALASTPDDVFINCPFDADYLPTFEAILFAIHACGFAPRSARELDDGSQTRVEKLYAIIGECRFGVHDLSRTELDKHSKLPRFNMPLELGIFLGAKRFGAEDQQLKRCLILDTEPYRYQKFASDLSGMDIHAHRNSAQDAIGLVRNWLANVTRRRLPGSHDLQRAHRKFVKDSRRIAARAGMPRAAIPYVDFNQIAADWLQKAGVRRLKRNN
jgi:hypothetical protein